MKDHADIGIAILSYFDHQQERCASMLWKIFIKTVSVYDHCFMAEGDLHSYRRRQQSSNDEAFAEMATECVTG